MACDLESLKSLENLLNEFFSNETTNEKKHELESILLAFGQQTGVWKQCLYYLSNSQNSYVSMFCLTTLDNIINKKWIGIMPEDRIEIRSTLYGFVLQNNKNAPSYIRNKLVKLIVDIARLSWPHFYPDFFTNILSLSRSCDSVDLCLIFLQTISEELVCSRSEISFMRKAELKRLLTQQVPAILSILTGVLDDIIEKCKIESSTTPPPSPSQTGKFSEDQLALSLHNADSLMNSVIETLHDKSLGNKLLDHTCSALPPMDAESQAVAGLALKCLSHLFSWINFSSIITPHLMGTIFIFASAGVSHKQNKRFLGGEGVILSGSEQNMTNASSNSSLGVLAMSAVNEILSKNCIPQDSEDFILQTFKNALALLSKLVRNWEGQSNHLETVDLEYLGKFSEFLRVFVSLHLARFETHPQFPLVDFLALLFQYTFQQPNTESYFGCLEIWSIILDHLIAKLETDQDSSCRSSYEDALLSLARGILHKVQFRLNQVELEELDHELMEDASYAEEEFDSNCGDLVMDGMTEWQTFYSNNLETVAKIADIFPEEVFSLIYSPFNEAAKIYLSLQLNIQPIRGAAGQPTQRRSLTILSEHECKKLHCLLRDLSSLMQAIGRLSILFLGENLTKRSSLAMQIIQKLIEMSNFATGLKMFEVEMPATVLHQDFVEVHAQILSTIRAWTHWLSQLYGQQFVQVFPGGTQTHRYQETCHNINRQMLVAAVNVVNCGAPSLIVNCGVQLLTSLSVLVKSPVALELRPIQNLYTQILSLELDMKVRHGLCRALVNFLLLPWPSFIIDHRMEARKEHLTNLLHSLTKDFKELALTTGSVDETQLQNNKTKMIDTLMMIRTQIDELNGVDKSSREIYYNCIKEFIQHTIVAFPFYIHVPDVCEEILSLIVMSVQVLRHQMGPSNVIMTVQKFLDVFTTDNNLYLAVLQCEQAAVKVLEKLLRLFELVICEPAQTFQSFIPDIISLCMNHIYPIIWAKSSPDVKVPLFRVLHFLLAHNWKYFFKSSVQTNLGNNNWDDCENEAHFLRIMEAFGQSLLQQDLTVFRQNLEALESLNLKYKLYHKTVFRERMLSQFITVLMQTLLQRSHDILQEEIMLTIYNMAAVDFEGYFAAFLTHFLQQTSGVTEDQKASLKDNFKPEVDLPSFTYNIQRFVNDLRFYRMCNDSLPSGTIKLEAP